MPAEHNHNNQRLLNNFRHAAHDILLDDPDSKGRTFDSQLAAIQTSSSRTGSRDGTDPVIIWRPSARVQLAVGLPPELKSVFMDERAQRAGLASYRSQNEAGTNDSVTLNADSNNDGAKVSGPAEPVTLKANAARRRVSEHARPPRPGPPPESSFTYRPRMRNAKVKYGAWYLPASHWRLPREGDESDEDVGANLTREASLPLPASKKTEDLSTLPISKAYKSFILKKDSERNAGNSYVPHYLREVGVEEK
jgi:hypothetical protein